MILLWHQWIKTKSMNNKTNQIILTSLHNNNVDSAAVMYKTNAFMLIKMLGCPLQTALGYRFSDLQCSLYSSMVTLMSLPKTLMVLNFGLIVLPLMTGTSMLISPLTAMPLK